MSYRGGTFKIPLGYEDADGDLASQCSASNPVNSSLGPCTCDERGDCHVEATYPRLGYASFDYTVTANAQTSPPKAIVFGVRHVGSSPSEEWAFIPSNTANFPTPAFFVMKYEAKAWSPSSPNDTSIDLSELSASGRGVDLNSYQPVSVGASGPWTEISPGDALDQCQSLGPHYGLISNREWMTMARDLETTLSNWVFDGMRLVCLKKGNTGIDSSCDVNEDDPAQALGNLDPSRIHTFSFGENIYEFSRQHFRVG